MSAPLIEFRNISVQRGSVMALDSINLSIAADEHIAILGPNGSGKSTLIKTIDRELYPSLKPDSSLRIMGEDIWNVFELRRWLGIVSNDLLENCTREITAREVVLSGFFSSIGLWPNENVTPFMEEKVREIMLELDIAATSDRWMTHLSSGERRRAIIGRALVHSPKALLLDEPTNSLDFAAVDELRTLLRRMAEGRGIVMVTHQLHDIIPEISRVVFLKKGKIAADGPKERLLTSSNLSHLLERSVRVVCEDGYYNFV
jgi:iron complex transport system ATP-binding protein